jgi:penicillin-binding protein 1A
MPDLHIDRKTKSRLKLLKNKWVAFSLFIPLLIILGISTKIIIDLPSLEALRNGGKRWSQGVTFQDRQGRWIFQWGGRRRIVKELDHFPDHLIFSLLASEDQRFFHHIGLDPQGILRAIWLKLSRGGRAQGGSTLTQQLAKEWVGHERSLSRKIREAFLALKLEVYFSKGELLERYLNQVYLGRGAYGFEEASFVYFGHSASSLSIAEAALLAALPPQPSALNPIKTPLRAKRRRDHVIHELHHLGWIKEQDATAALSEPLPTPRAKPMLRDWAPDYLIEVKRQLKKALLWDELQGQTVTLSIDLPIQIAAEQAIQKGLKVINHRQKQAQTLQNKRASRTTFSTLENKSLEAALITLDLHHHTGHIPVLAAIGSADHERSHFHRATQSCLPLASTIKPLIYSYALSKGHTWKQRLSDAPVSIFDKNTQKIWRPKSRRTRGKGITMLNALANSHNTPIIHLTKKLGVHKVKSWVERFGIVKQPKDLTLALGSGCASPQDLSLAYAHIAQHHFKSLKAQWYTLPSQGIKSPLNLWNNLEEMNMAMFQSLSNHDVSPTHSTDQMILNSIDQALSAVVEYGTAKSAKGIGFEVRGKTGSHEQSDTWFVGYRPERLTTVWVGSDPRGRRLNRQESGSKTALPIWLDFSRESAHGLQASFPSLQRTQISPKVHQTSTIRHQIQKRATPHQVRSDRIDHDILEAPF